MNIKVLGGGCRSCEALLKAVKEAVESRELNDHRLKAGGFGGLKSTPAPERRNSG